MDNLCHTLVGAALAESGLKRRTALGAATLMIAANFADIDVLSLPTGHGLGFRRGLTHGVVALVVLPFVLTALMVGWARLRRRVTPPDARELLLLSAIGMATHPVLDWMNTYGVRWFEPFSGTWSYGDALFIIDPWIWTMLAIGVLMSSRRDARPGTAPDYSSRPARVATGLAAAYIIAMVATTVATRRLVEAELASRGIRDPHLVVDPVPLDPLRRRVIYASDGAYHVAQVRWPDPVPMDGGLTIPINRDHPEITAAARTTLGREFLGWSRLPFYVIQPSADTTWVLIGDARYTFEAGRSWAAVRVPLPRPSAHGSPVTTCRSSRRQSCEPS